MHKIYFAHNTCLNSSYDLNIVKEALRLNKYCIVDKIEKADTCIYAGCGVRNVWTDNAINEANQIIKKNKNIKVIATGCFTAIDSQKIRQNIKSKNLKLIPFKDIVEQYTDFTFEEIDQKFSQNEKILFEGDNHTRKRINIEKESILKTLRKIDNKYKLNIAEKYRKTTKGYVFYHEEEPLEYIAITRGCPYKCSYCSIPVGRGGVYQSTPLEDILSKANSAKEKGTNRLLLIGDEIGNYGLGNKNLNLGILIENLLSGTALKISLRYIEPEPFLKHYDVIKKFCKTGQIELLYIPIQSGSNRILKLMNRPYSIDNTFTQKLKYLRENTNVVFYTNWMVGFNSETERDFSYTVDLAKLLNFQINMVIPFSEKKNTKAATIPEKIPISKKIERHKILFDIVKNMKKELFRNEFFDIDKNEMEDILDKIKVAENYSILVD